MGFLAYLASPWTDPNRKQSARGDSLYALDGVRGLAVMIVIASHCNVAGMEGQGSLGVLLFFMLSGFVLTLPFTDRPERIFQLSAVSRFFANRALRILPIFVVALLYIKSLMQQDWVWFYRNVTFSVGWSHLWSVAEEARFYALFPFVIAALAYLPNRAARILALMAMIWIAWRFQYTFMIDMMVAGHAEFFFWFFLAGMLACFLHEPARALADNPIAKRLLGTGALLIVAFIFASSDAMIRVFWRPMLPSLPPDFAMNGWAWSVPWCALFVLLLVSVTVFQGSMASRAMQSWLMRHLGLLSYSLYLFHVPVMILLEPYGLSPMERFAATFAATYAIAIVSYLAVEKPFLMLKPHGQRKRTTSLAAPG